MTTLTKSQAILVQRAINVILVPLKHPPIKIDGDIGQKTKTALQTIQKVHKLNQTGELDTATKQLIDKVIKEKFINEESFALAARELSVEVARVKAVVEVEAKGAGFFDDGRIAILFERHIFYRELRKILSPASLANLVKTHPDICNPSTGGYIGGPKEWDRLAKAAKIHKEAAHLSASYGLGQVMGFNYKVAGYKNVFDMVEAFDMSETNQLLGMINFIKSNRNLVTAIQKLDWASFARGYNGPSYAKNNYDVKLAVAYKKHQK